MFSQNLSLTDVCLGKRKLVLAQKIMEQKLGQSTIWKYCFTTRLSQVTYTRQPFAFLHLFPL
jgi:hypothetical protein